MILAACVGTHYVASVASLPLAYQLVAGVTGFRLLPKWPLESLAMDRIFSTVWPKMRHVDSMLLFVENNKSKESTPRRA
jgi:hypothetical protein